MPRFGIRTFGRFGIGALLLLSCPTIAFSQQDATTSYPVIEAVDSEPDGDLDGADLVAAFRRCDRLGKNAGCVVELLPAVYRDVQVKVPPTVYEIRGQGELSILRGPVRPKNAPILLREPRDGGYGTRFRNFTIDGNKQNLLSSPGAHHNCIRVTDKTAQTLSGGLIREITCKNVAGEGIYLEDAPDWKIQNNVITYIGCWDATGTNEVPWRPNEIDARLMSCGLWGQSQPDEFNQPGRVTTGIGIEISRNSHNVEISGNRVRYFTKIGIQGIAGAANAPSLYPRNGRVFSNVVEWGLTGIAMVRTIGWTVENNLVQDLSPPWMYGNVGKGYACSHGGNGNRFTENIAIRTGGAGFSFGCSCIGPNEGSNRNQCDIVAERNVTLGSCLRMGKRLGALDVKANEWKPGMPYREGVRLTDNVVVDTACEATVMVRGYKDVAITGSESSLDSGSRYGLLIMHTSDVDVDATILRGLGEGVGVMADAHSKKVSISGTPGGMWKKQVVDRSTKNPR